MTGDLERIVGSLTARGRQRGVRMVGELQQELEDAKAPADSFELVFAELLEAGIDIREESDTALGLSPRTVKTNWAVAQLWLMHRLEIRDTV